MSMAKCTLLLWKKTLQWFVNSNFFYKHSLKDEEGLNSCGSLKYGKTACVWNDVFYSLYRTTVLDCFVSSLVISHLYCILHVSQSSKELLSLALLPVWEQAAPHNLWCIWFNVFIFVIKLLFTHHSEGWSFSISRQLCFHAELAQKLEYKFKKK